MSDLYEFIKPKRYVHTVFLHCSATDNPEHDNTEFIRRIHVEEKGWLDIGYHYFIDKNGKVFSCRPLERIPAAQFGHNTGTIAICLSGHREFTDSQFDVLRELCSVIQSEYSERLRFRGHREVDAKECPVFDYIQILNLTSNGFLKERRQNINDSRVVKSAKVITGSAVGLEIINNVDLPAIAAQASAASSIINIISSFSHFLPHILIGVIIAAAAYVCYSRWQDWKDGIR